MNCPKCGQPVEPGAAFCGNCGQPLQATASAPSTPPQAQAPQAPPQQSASISPTVISPTTSAQPGANPPSSPASPVITPIAQVMANQPTGPAPAVGSFTPATGVVSAGGAMPTYAAPIAGAQNAGETRAIIALVVGVIGIPAALLPIVGLPLGILGLVLGTTARSHYKHLLSLLAIIFSSLAIIVSLAAWVYNVEYISSHKTTGSSGSSANGTASGSLKSLSTPCYDVKLVSGLNSYTPSGCDFDSSNSTDEYTVEAAVKPDITQANLQQAGQYLMQAGVQNINGTIASQKSGTFAGSPAYIATISSSDGEQGIAAVVLHSSVNQQNIFYVAHFVKSGSPTLDDLEKNWQWH